MTIATAERNTPEKASNQDQQLVDRIIYLASLASARSEIDPMLDTLRSVTARLTPGETLSTNDIATLTTLEQKLKDYIINEDPLRAFSPESLEKRLYGQTGERKFVARKKIRLVGVVGLSVAVALTPLALPPYSSMVTKLSLFSVPLFFLGLAFGTVMFYLTALGNFRPELRRAFIWLCLGVVVLGMAFSHYALIPAFNLERYPIFQYSGITWLVTIAFICLYVGLYIYARLLSIKTIFASWWGLLAVAAGIVLAVLAPHSSQVTHEIFFDVSFSGIVTLAVISALAAGVARSVVRNVTNAYAKSMRLLYYYFAIGSIGSLGSAAALAALGQVYGPALSLIIVLCGIMPQLLLLYTGYSFKKETSS